MTTRTPRACDACRLRKVRCSSSQPCSQCAHLNLACVYSPAPAKRKPGVRGRLVAQLRDGARTKANSITPEAPGPDSPTSEGSAATGYPPEFFLQLLPEFEAIVYPMNPTITPEEMRAAIGNMHRSHEDAALIYAYAAVTINLSRTSKSLHDEVPTQMTDLIQRCLNSHRQADITITHDGTIGELPVSVKRIVTCIFLEISTMGIGRIERSFWILREAISLTQMLKVHLFSEETHGRQYVACRQRLYWEAFIHERFMTIMSGHPSVLPPLSTGFPLSDPSLPPHVDVGWSRLIRLFCIMDDRFLTHWNALQDPNYPAPEMTAQWIESKQAELDLDEAATDEAERALIARGGGGFTELQHADLFVTRLWLRTLVWQLALSRGLLRSAPPQNTHQGLSLHFPAQRLSAQLRTLVTRLNSVISIATHGSGIIQKLFEITSSIADVMALPPGHGQSQEDADKRMGDFVFLVRFMFGFERIQKEQRRYLREKLEVLQPMYKAVDFGALAGSPI